MNENISKDYYNAKDIQELSGCSQSFAYQLIRKLRDKFTKKYPESITIQGKIPVWFFEEVMLNKKVKKEEE